MYLDDREGVFGFAFQHPIIALVLVFLAIYAVSALMPKLGGAALSWVWEAVKAFFAWVDSRGKQAIEQVGKTAIPATSSPTAPASGLGANSSADDALSSQQKVLSYAVKTGDTELLATALAVFPVLLKAGKETAK